MDEDVIQKVKQALEDQDFATIENALRNANSRGEKLEITKVVFGYKDDLTLRKFGTSQDSQARSVFIEKVDGLFFKLLGDKDTRDYLISEGKRSLEMGSKDEKLGSGDLNRPLNYYFCSNADLLKNKLCPNQGNRRCTQCGLAAYCSTSCQKEHWPIHKSSCHDGKNLVARWTPHWVHEKRQPHFMVKSSDKQKPTLEVRLWGTTPAVDLIGFKCNEHKENSIWQKPMNLAFVASGDFRSMVETLASIPDEYQQPITIVLNDENPVIVARNLLMLNLLLMRGEAALDMVIALWYSSGLTQSQQVTIGISSPRTTSNNRLEHGLSVVEFNQLDAVSDIILSMNLHSIGLDVISALKARRSIMSIDDDILDRSLLGLKGYHHISFAEFLKRGLVQPFNQRVHLEKNVPNNFLIQPGELKWLVDGTCDPKQGWPMVKVMEFGDQKKMPENDLYGRLFFYIRDRLSKMLSTMRRLPVKIRMFQKDPKTLAKELQPAKFDRIDLTNATDQGEHGIDKMLNVWGPLLNKKNPNSAIVTLSRKWTDFLPESVQISTISPHLLSRMVSLIGLDRANMVDMTDHVNKFLIQDAVVKFGDHSEEFEKYMKKIDEKKQKYLNRRMEHTIVPHQVMFPIEGKPNTTIESLPERDQYWIFNCTANPTDRYSEWTLGEK